MWWDHAPPHKQLLFFFFFFFLSSNSDDNMLKNIELFDKLSLRFNGRVLFIKDVIGDEICCWSFYGQGRKIAEVCCTSIVYATEKKQTKVNTYSVLVGPLELFFLFFFSLSIELWCSVLFFSVSCITFRLSSLRQESMRRPSTSSCTSPTMGGVRTMPCWRPQGALQDDLIIWMRMKSESEWSEFVGFISNDLMTAHITTSDFCLFWPARLCLGPWTVFAPCLCLTTTSASLFDFPSSFTSFSGRLLWDDCCTTMCDFVIVLFACPLVYLWSSQAVVYYCLFVSHNNFYHWFLLACRSFMNMDVCIQHYMQLQFHQFVERGWEVLVYICYWSCELCNKQKNKSSIM